MLPFLDDSKQFHVVSALLHSNHKLSDTKMAEFEHLAQLTESEFRESLQKWKKPTADFDTLVISETVDPGTFTTNSLVVPIVTSSVFKLQGSPSQHIVSVCSRVSNNTFH